MCKSVYAYVLGVHILYTSADVTPFLFIGTGARCSAVEYFEDTRPGSGGKQEGAVDESDAVQVEVCGVYSHQMESTRLVFRIRARLSHWTYSGSQMLNISL